MGFSALAPAQPDRLRGSSRAMDERGCVRPVLGLTEGAAKGAAAGGGPEEALEGLGVDVDGASAAWLAPCSTASAAQLSNGAVTKERHSVAKL